eukprot:g13591.t2
MGRRSALVAGLCVLVTCGTGNAFRFPPPGPTSILRSGGSGGGAGSRGDRSAVSRRSAASGVEPSRWAWGGRAVASSTPVFQPRRRRRWRDGSAGSGSVVKMMSSSLEAGLGDMFNEPDERILKAVEKAGNRAVPSDIAALAGVDLSVAKRGLVNLANIVGGDLEVSRDGDVVYNFPSNFRASLLSKSAYRRAVESVRKAWPLIFYGIRVSFGVVLLSSILLIFTTIFFAATYANSSSDDSRGDRRRGGGFDSGGGFGGGRGIGFNTYFGPSPFDFFYYRPYYGYYGTPVPRGGRRSDPEEMGLLESIFSFIFGDGDPNAGMDQRRVEAVATLIRGNGGAVSAEQLAPLLTPGSLHADDNNLVDESFVLPILTALDGAPEVTADGDIVYVFPSLQTSAMGTGAAALGGGRDPREAERLQGLKSLSTADLRIALEAVGVRAMSIFERSELIDAAMRAGIAKLDDGNIVQETPASRSPPSRASAPAAGGRGVVIPEPLEEVPRPFSVAARWKKVAAGALGAVNLGGALYLQNLLSGPAFVGVTLPGYFGFVQGALPFLLTYAVALNVIPAVRWLVNKKENAKIEERNFLRRKWAEAGRSGSVVVQRKLKAAKSMATDLKVVEAEDVEYTTAKSLSDQGSSVDDDLLDDFDMRLQSTKK